MAGLLYDSTEAAIVQREILDENIMKQYEEEAVFASLFPFDSQAFVHDAGAYWVDDMEPGGGFRGMSATQRTFGEGSRPGRVKFKITFSELARTIKLAGRVLHLDKKSLVEGWAPLMRSAMSAFIKQMNFEHHGDGSGKLATVAAIDGANAIVTFTQPVGAALLFRRERYNFVDPANTATKRTITIAAVAETAPYLISKSGGYIGNFGNSEDDTAADAYTATTIVAGDLVVLRDHGGAAVKGLRYHVSNAAKTYQNVDNSVWPQLIPPIVPAGGGPLSTRLLDHLEYALIYRQGKKQALDGNFWVISPAQHAAYRKLGYNAPNQIVKRFGAGDRLLDLGYTTIEHNGRMFLLDVDCDESWVPFIDRSTFKRFGAKAPSVVDDGGGGGVLNKVYDSSGNLNWEYTINVNSLTELANRGGIYKNGAVDNLQFQGLPLKADTIIF